MIYNPAKFHACTQKPTILADFCTYVSAHTSLKSSDCPSAISYGSTTAITKQSKADLLNQFFTSSFNPSVVQRSYGPSPTPGPLPDHLEIIPAEVAMLLKKIKPHSASGPDSVSAWMLRSLADVASPSIASLFNLSLRLGKLPKDWKLGNVVPIPKGTNTSEVQFY